MQQNTKSMSDRLTSCSPGELMKEAAAIRDSGFSNLLTYSPKVFIPLTHLCRDVCHYCTFAKTPGQVKSAYLSLDEILALANAGSQAGCKEALFTLGDRPEHRYSVARTALAELGHRTTLEYLAEAAAEVFAQTCLLPHLNPGVMSLAELQLLRGVSVSCGLMLESASERLCQKGGPHYGSPDKHPAVRLKTIEDAGKLNIPFTTGILVGIGETRQDRIESLLAIRELHERYGHIQEIIIQNFRSKQNTLMRDVENAQLDEHLWTISSARLIFGADMSIQAPPNLQPGALASLVDAGINDWGGISPITPDHVNPEAPWPGIADLAKLCGAMGRELVARAAVYPEYISNPAKWIDPKFHTDIIRSVDSTALLRDSSWVAGKKDSDVPELLYPWAGKNKHDQPGAPPTIIAEGIAPIVHRAIDGKYLDETSIARLFTARGRNLDYVVDAANQLRRNINGENVSYVVNRNINYTNICYYKCGFCAFSKGAGNSNLRGDPYDLAIGKVVEMAREAWHLGATEVCMQGGIHPNYTGQHYLEICSAIKTELPGIHIHAFSPLEIYQGANSLGVSIEDFLIELKNNGLNSLPGTAAEILDDEIREIICPDKLKTRQWIEVIETAHTLGIPTTSTIMFGHVDGPVNWARHLAAIRDLQVNTGGITEFVPLPFVAEKTPVYRKGIARNGPTLREAVLMHAVARLVFQELIPNIQTSWVKMGALGAGVCLQAGANDLGGTLMNESISTAAGANHAQEMTCDDLQTIANGAGRNLVQRNTLYEHFKSTETPVSHPLNESQELRVGV